MSTERIKYQAAAQLLDQTAAQIQSMLPHYRLKLLIQEADVPAGMPNYGLLTTILHEICNYEGIEAHALTGPKGSWEQCDMRQLIWLILKEDAAISLVEIGKFFNRHHATIISGIKHIKGIIDTDAAMYNRCEVYRNIIRPFIHLYKNYHYDNNNC